MEINGVVLVYVIILALFAGIPLILDILLAYWAAAKTRNLLLERAPEDQLPEISKSLKQAPPGIPGLARSMMALTVIIILGIAVFHLLAQSPPQDSSNIVNNVMSMLAGLLAAITGFYFGGKAAETKTRETRNHPEAKKDH